MELLFFLFPVWGKGSNVSLSTDVECAEHTEEDVSPGSLASAASPLLETFPCVHIRRSVTLFRC